MPSAAMGMCLEVVILSEVSQRQIPHVIACMWHLEQWYKWNYLWDRNRLRHRKQTYGYQTGGEEGDKLRVWGWNIHITIYKIYNQQEPTV